MKYYTLKEAVEITGIKRSTLRSRLLRDSKKPINKQKYPKVKKFGIAFSIPEIYLCEK